MAMLSMWVDVESLEVSQVDGHNSFDDLGKGSNPGQVYKKIRAHKCRACRHDGHKRGT